MKIVVRPLNENRWAGVISYRNCHIDLCPYLLKNGSRYTGFNNKEDQKIQKELEEAIITKLHPESEFWDTFFIRMTDEDLVLNTDDVYDRLKYMFLKNHKDVKSSPVEMKAGARYVMINEEAEAERNNSKSKTKREVYNAIDKMTVQDMRDALRLYGERSEDFSASIAESKLMEYVDRNPERFKQIWIDNKSRKTQVLIERATQKGIIKKSGSRFIFGKEDMGVGITAAIAWLDNLENQDKKLVILEQLK